MGKQDVYGNIVEMNQMITDFKPFKFKSRFTNNNGNPGTTNVEIAVPMKYSSNF